MEKLTGKGKYSVKLGNRPHKCGVETSNREMERMQRQDAGNAFEIKGPEKESCLYTGCSIETSWQPHTENLQ